MQSHKCLLVISRFVETSSTHIRAPVYAQPAHLTA